MSMNKNAIYVNNKQIENSNSSLDGFELRFGAIINYEWEDKFNKNLKNT